MAIATPKEDVSVARILAATARNVQRIAISSECLDILSNAQAEKLTFNFKLGTAQVETRRHVLVYDVLSGSDRTGAKLTQVLEKPEANRG